MTTTPNELANVRYDDDVAAAVDFYTAHLGFTLHTNAVPAFGRRASADRCGCCSQDQRAPVPEPHPTISRTQVATASI